MNTTFTKEQLEAALEFAINIILDNEGVLPSWYCTGMQKGATYETLVECEIKAKLARNG